jgi:hypothetical protein
MHIDISDDVSSTLVYSGSLRSGDPLPLEITKKTGVYRIIISDATGISGEMTFSVVSGPLSQIRIVPISSALVRGSRTLSMISLLDRLTNPISPDLHTLRIDISGGYAVDAQGTRQTSLTLDVMDSQVPLLIGSDTPGILTMTVTTETGIVSKKEIKIYDAAQIVLSRSADPRVGGDSVGVHIEVRDPRTNQPLS